jgi:hypothetical protein
LEEYGYDVKVPSGIRRKRLRKSRIFGHLQERSVKRYRLSFYVSNLFSV